MTRQTYRLNRVYIGVCVKHAGSAYIITDETGPTVTGVKPNTLLVEFTGTVKSQNAQPIRPTGTFFITAETSDPYHIILDIMDRSVIDYTGLT